MKLTHQPRVALVTGAGRGIGKAIAGLLAADGHTVICVSKNPDSCTAAANAINATGASARAYPVDVSSPEAVAQACAAILSDFESVDILVNNAGITKDGLLLRMSDSDWQSVLSTNLSSAFYWTRGLARPMTRKRWGRIINIGSVVGRIGNPGQANYAAAKAGLHGLTMSLAREFASRNITANTVAPGFITTDMTEKLTDDQKETIKKVVPLQRFGAVTDVAALVDFLVSEEAGYITGQIFSVDGGMAM
ncbi:MAG: 3-oxoacyl-[acyl-carrier-protein] reductase [Puniceicoccales bacterium]|jgi:3-oxoacyl-[acyl-carrier protein] reductase|nr:3-oxoacyl-[acyl-carrier-protein] reductase [Puniceicoccales bacterium]